MKILTKNDLISFIKSRREKLLVIATVNDLWDGEQKYKGMISVKDSKDNTNGGIIKKVVFFSRDYDFEVSANLLSMQDNKLTYKKSGTFVQFII